MRFFPRSKLNKGISDIDVVISGGGLRGYYVTGASVILHKVLKENNIRIARYAGTSCGAWCAAFMAMGLSTSTGRKHTYCQRNIALNTSTKQYMRLIVNVSYHGYTKQKQFQAMPTKNVPTDALSQ